MTPVWNGTMDHDGTCPMLTGYMGGSSLLGVIRLKSELSYGECRVPVPYRPEVPYEQANRIRMRYRRGWAQVRICAAEGLSRGVVRGVLGLKGKRHRRVVQV